MHSVNFESHSGITLYSQVAGVLRRRIEQGEWSEGQEIPTLDEICEQYGVGRVTARQAVQRLVSEGLLSSRRGRRTVVVEQERESKAPLAPGLIAPLEEVPNYSVTLLEKDDDARIPPSISAVGRIDGDYVRIRKLDRESGAAYCMSDVYVYKPLFKRFRKNAAQHSKMARLVRDGADPPLKSAKERITISVAQVDEARLLNCPLAAPVARVQRIFTDIQGRVLYAAWSVYRGDRILIERDLLDIPFREA